MGQGQRVPAVCHLAGSAADRNRGADLPARKPDLCGVIYSMRVLITGGAGFIGSNAVHRFLRRGAQVTIYDNLSRRGSISNLEWLRAQHGADSFTLDSGGFA